MPVAKLWTPVYAVCNGSDSLCSGKRPLAIGAEVLSDVL